jgi:hypothetical protein
MSLSSVRTGAKRNAIVCERKSELVQVQGATEISVALNLHVCAWRTPAQHQIEESKVQVALFRIT